MVNFCQFFFHFDQKYFREINSDDNIHHKMTAVQRAIVINIKILCPKFFLNHISKILLFDFLKFSKKKFLISEEFWTKFTFSFFNKNHTSRNLNFRGQPKLDGEIIVTWFDSGSPDINQKFCYLCYLWWVRISVGPHFLLWHTACNVFAPIFPICIILNSTVFIGSIWKRHRYLPKLIVLIGG